MNNLFQFDENFNKIIIGTDEAGRGPAAGGVFVGAVCFREKSETLINELSGINDSKKLSKKRRETLFNIIKENTINSVICIGVKEIEEINILNASLKGMKLTCEAVLAQLHLAPDTEFLTLVDGNKLIKDYPYPQKYIIKGDGTSASIAAASILAKVTRDRYMEKLDAEFPQYGWAKNAGYLTHEHLSAIDKYGLTPYHRPSFLQNHFNKQLSLL